ncbi:DUF4173 domain-containing protein [uncultured Maribacter sp.]|uniref:DUF4153 domain-containing protein n=1 Tax=uncultured Maribacter sp. TaxID=431308 RepID=UPI0026165A53|nr:DUF4173 domain-containing protein [uncultured Maribacter sp.]
MNTHIKSILSALAFSILFYSKSFGLNLFLISILIVSLLMTLKKEHYTSWKFPTIYLLSALLVFITPTNYTIFVHAMAFLLFIGKSIAPNSPIYLSWSIGVMNMIVASAINYNERTKGTETTKKEISNTTINYIKGIIAAILLLFAFSLLYKNANPVFNEVLTQISFDFISVPWLFFTFIGYVLFQHILRPYNPKDLIEQDEKIGNNLEKPKQSFSLKTLKKVKEEHTLGSIIFIALNVLLVFFLTTDVIYLLQENSSIKVSYSSSVHQGVYALMFSIICAIILILYFFRGNLNFYKKNKQLKTLTFLWIGLNVILALFTCIKNYQYVEALGLTYKRIGVFVYILLTLIGLITTYIKVNQLKNFYFLLRTNITILFSCLFISALIPWDKAITEYNLTQIYNPDITYLIQLGVTNSKQLHTYSSQNKGKIKEKDFERINAKYSSFLKKESERTWQEYTLYQLTDNNNKQ